MPNYLHEGSIIQCSHGGELQVAGLGDPGFIIQCSHGGELQVAGLGDPGFKVDNQPALTEQSITCAPISGCGQSAPAKPCTRVTAILLGKSTTTKANGSALVLDSLVALTDGGPPGTIVLPELAGQQISGERPVQPIVKTVSSGDAPSWITIELIDEDDRPVPRELVRVVLPNQQVVDARLDSRGRLRIEGVEEGECEVTFPSLDKEAWERA